MPLPGGIYLCLIEAPSPKTLVLFSELREPAMESSAPAKLCPDNSTKLLCAQPGKKWKALNENHLTLGSWKVKLIQDAGLIFGTVFRSDFCIHRFLRNSDSLNSLGGSHVRRTNLWQIRSPSTCQLRGVKMGPEAPFLQFLGQFSVKC